MNALIEVFRMTEVSVEVRIKILKQLGRAINAEYGMNITEPLVYELVLSLDQNNEIKNDPHFKSFQKDSV